MADNREQLNNLRKKGTRKGTIMKSGLGALGKLFSLATEALPRKQQSMEIYVTVSRVQFIIPTKMFQQTLVTAGDILVVMYDYPTHDHAKLWLAQKKMMNTANQLQRTNTETELKFDASDADKLTISRKNAENLNRTRYLDIQLTNFEIFLCQFQDLLIKSWIRVHKRHLLMPLDLHLTINEYAPVLENPDYSPESENPESAPGSNPKYITKSKRIISGELKSIRLKATINDLDVLFQIQAHQGELMASVAASTPPPTKQIHGLGDANKFNEFSCETSDDLYKHSSEEGFKFITVEKKDQQSPHIRGQFIQEDWEVKAEWVEPQADRLIQTSKGRNADKIDIAHPGHQGDQGEEVT
jgi:hypothetical protein